MRLKIGPDQQFFLFGLALFIFSSTTIMHRTLNQTQPGPSRPVRESDAISARYLADKALDDARTALYTKTRKELGIGKLRTLSAPEGQYSYRIEDLSDTNDLSLCLITATSAVPDLKSPRISQGLEVTIRKENDTFTIVSQRSVPAQ